MYLYYVQYVNINKVSRVKSVFENVVNNFPKSIRNNSIDVITIYKDLKSIKHDRILICIS